MEKICLKAGSIFLFEAFQFIKAEKCKIQIKMCVGYFLCYQANTKQPRACNDVAMLDLKPHNSLFHAVHPTHWLH